MKKNRKRRNLAYKLIQLTRGMVAAVSLEDAERVSQYRWCPDYSKRKACFCGIGTKIRGRRTSLARFILGIRPGDTRHVDHRNHNIWDNRRANLRVCTLTENNWNKRKYWRKGRAPVSKFIGVSPIRGGKLFTAGIWVRGRRRHIGDFETEELAARAYDKAARKTRGEFAQLNFSQQYEKPLQPPPEVVGQTAKHTASQYDKQCKRISGFVGIGLHRGKWRWRVGCAGPYGAGEGFLTAQEAAKAREVFIIENELPNARNF